MQAATHLATHFSHDAPALTEAAHAAVRAHLFASGGARAAPHAGEGRAQRRRRSWYHVHDAAVDSSRWMAVQHRRVGDFRIVAGVLDAPDGGYIAAVAVHRVGAAGDAEVIFGSEQISGEHRFATAALALRHALDVGHQAIRLHKSLDA